MHSKGVAVLINVGYALIGPDLKLVQEVNIEVIDGVITHIGRGFASNADITLRMGIAIPALVNAHMHILDYAFPEYDASVKSLEEAVSEPYGLKHRLLVTLGAGDIAQTCRKVFLKMLKAGITTAIIFSELPQAIDLIKAIGTESGVGVVVLGRPRGDVGVEKVLSVADGLGLDSPLRYSKEELLRMRRCCRAAGKIIATHVAETKRAHERGDFELAVNYLDVDIIVHGVYLTETEIEMVARTGKTIVVCPRSNMRFGVGVPPIAEFLNYGVNVLVGTDNAGVVEPDVWRELELVYDILRLRSLDVDAKEVLKMATVNIEKVQGLGVSCIIDEGRRANFIILDAEDIDASRSRNVYATIVRRGGGSKVLKVVKGANLW